MANENVLYDTAGTVHIGYQTKQTARNTKPLDLRAALHVAMQIAAILNAFRTVGRTVNNKCLVF